jgi:hypothetical protein
LFFNFFPGQFAALPAQVIAEFCEFFFLAQQLFAAGNPLLGGDYFLFLNSCAWWLG